MAWFRGCFAMLLGAAFHYAFLMYLQTGELCAFNVSDYGYLMSADSLRQCLEYYSFFAEAQK
jgi:hypothetical protein